MADGDFNARGIALTRLVRTETLALSFQMTDELMASGLTSQQHCECATARGWILEVLEERGQLGAIGLNADYEELV